ncbi:MAG: fatty acid--CoA ligase family protein [Verrucomicrobiaceae bacterium]|nr:fatty acid--CoA ligase family protein [Verrucomicrobiaceae bacterium]
MLFDLWQSTVRRLRDRDALVDVHAGTRLSFGEMDSLVAAEPRLVRGEIVPACTAHGLPSFIVRTLCAWRDGGVLCPFESRAPDLTLLRGLPAGIAHVKSTSGSTGGARFVLFREEQLLADVRNISTTMGFDARLPNLGVISAAHSYGFSHLVLPLLIDGMPLWHVPDPLPESMRVAFTSGGDFFLPAVPAMWRAWHLAGVLKGAPVRLAMSAGAPLPLELEQQVFAESGIKIHNFYGASECGGIAYDDSAVPRTDAALVGRPLNGVRVAADEEGCMVITSDAVGLGYWPPRPDSPIRDGTVTAPDLAEITEAGVRLVGRKSDTINVAGRKIPPSDIEHALLEMPRITHCVVFGVPGADAARVEDIVACVNCDAKLGQDEITAFLATRLPAWQMPRRWWITGTLVPDERGKISRALWRERFLSESTAR